MYTTLKGVAVASLAVSLTACAPGATTQDGPLPPAEKATQVQVTNNNWSDMTVYVERNGTLTRLGSVTSMTERLFHIPRAFVSAAGSIRLVADPLGAREGHMTDPIQVTPGQVVEFRIENQVQISSVSVFNR